MEKFDNFSNESRPTDNTELRFVIETLTAEKAELAQKYENTKQTLDCMLTALKAIMSMANSNKNTPQ